MIRAEIRLLPAGQAPVQRDPVFLFRRLISEMPHFRISRANPPVAAPRPIPRSRKVRGRTHRSWRRHPIRPSEVVWHHEHCKLSAARIGILSGRGSQPQADGACFSSEEHSRGYGHRETSQVGEHAHSKHFSGQIACSLGRTNSMFATDNDP